MKRLIALLLILLLLPSAACAETIVTSFFPIYLFTLNLTQGIDGLEVRSLTPPGAGCLHDYQLQTSDMKALAAADAFLINGAGMETYMAGVFDVFPNLPVVDASVGIELLEDCHEHDHGHEEAGEPDDHGHGHEANAHIWLDAGNAAAMVHNLADGLMALLPEHAEAIRANRDAYAARLTALDGELTDAIARLPRRDVITFHEAFPYFAEAYGLHVAAVVSRDPDDPLAPREMADLVRSIRALGNPPLFTEPQYENLAAQLLARETGAGLYLLDPVVTGPEGIPPLTWYEDTMRANLQVLIRALGQ